MAKHLRIITEDKRLEGVKKSKVEDGQVYGGADASVQTNDPETIKFVAKHKVDKHDDRVGNKEVTRGGPVKPALTDPKNAKLKPDAKVYESACNMTEAGVSCPVHEMDACPGVEPKNMPKGSKKVLLDKKVKEDVEQIDEMPSVRARQNVSRTFNVDKQYKMQKDRNTAKSFKQPGTPSKSDLRASAEKAVSTGNITKLPAGKAKGIKEEEQIDEVITKKTKAGEIIKDFMKSKDPKFAGKSPKERQKMALGAYYGMHPEKSKMEEDAAEPMLEGGKKKKSCKEDGQIMPAKTDSGVADDAGRIV